MLLDVAGSKRCSVYHAAEIIFNLVPLILVPYLVPKFICNYGAKMICGKLIEYQWFILQKTSFNLVPYLGA